MSDREEAGLDASAIVLAGGRSERMGAAKALLPFGEGTLLERVVGILKPLFAEVVVVAAPGQELPPVAARRVDDEIPSAGPMGGLHAGLKAIRQEVAFVTACDVPFLAPALARLLVERARGCALAVPEWRGRIHPLPGAYSRRLVGETEGRLRAGKLRLGALAEVASACVVGEEEVRRVDPEGLSFVNLNTPEEYARALGRLSRKLDGGPMDTQPGGSA